ncbi:redoxin domain-containing protein [Pseudoglutamicibacter albus]|uniref:redoxin domain-containing protein n=1 Tax=Pseudoglutamicibacter albus TaxID=98671 RepID=UPI00068D2DB3|nr:redoxin domain-containing protein [Pseudoglutamicibacter albus]MCG7304336.1 redoxin domain-containing protein [Pseudoglutamicibacter albus]
MLLNPSDAAPGLASLSVPLVNQHGERVVLADRVGQVTVLSFFPLSFTPVCHSELGGLAQVADAWAEAGVYVAACSVDSRYTLRTVSDQLGLGFDLLSDFWPHGALAQKLDAFDAGRGHATRTAFVWDASGRLVSRIEADRTASRPLDSYVEALRAAGAEL